MKLSKLSILACSVSLSLQVFSQDFIYTFSGEIDSTLHEKIKLVFEENIGLHLTGIVCKPESKTGALFIQYIPSEAKEVDISSFSFALLVKSILLENNLSPKEFLKL